MPELIECISKFALYSSTFIVIIKNLRMGSAETFDQSSAAFRKHLPDLTSPRFTTAKEQDAYSYAETFFKTHHPPWLFNLTEAWKQLYEEPYVGVTTDGQFPPLSDEPNLWQLQLIITPKAP